MGTCGVGNWDGPQPGDPSNNIILSAAGAYGGIDVSWTYPTVNPYAVAHVTLYRGINSNFSSAIAHTIANSNFFFDRIPKTEIQPYYYWLKVVSINGTEGALIGPATATPMAQIFEVIEDLTGLIDEGVLAQALRDKITKIGTLDQNLIQETLSRASDNIVLTAALAAVQSSTDEAVTLILNEATQRASADAAVIASTNVLAVGIAGNTAAIVEERDLRVTLTDAMLSDITILQGTVESNTAAIVAERDIRISDIAAMAETINTIVVTAGGGIGSALEAEATVRAAADTSLASQITTAESALGADIAAAQTTLQTNISTVDGKVTSIGARYTAVVDVNGLVGGFGVYNDGTVVEAGFDVDRFWIGRTTNKRKPFIIDNGVVYIDDAAINKLTFSKLRAADGSLIVDNGQIKADYIDTKGLVIKDILGNVIFGAGTGLDWSLINSKPTTLAEISTAEAGKLSGIAVGATVGAPAGTSVNGVAVATLTNNATNGAAAYTATVNYRTTGAPTNVPVPNGITITTNTNASCNIKLSWGAYTQGTKQADFLVVFWCKTGTAPVVTDSSIMVGVNTVSSYYIFEGVNPADTYSFGIAAARRTENGVEIGTIVTPTVSPDWLGITVGTPNFIANVGGTPAATLVTNATTALANASTAQATADAATTSLSDIASDAKLTPSEKQSLRSDWDVLVSEKAGINAGVTTYAAVATENATYNAAFQALGNYLNNSSAYTISTVTPPSWINDANLATTTTIVGSTFRSTWKAVYDARQALLNKIAVEAGKVADWATVSGANKPADNATVGAPAGTLVNGVAVETVTANAANGATAFTGTVAYRTTGAPTNAPAITSTVASQSADGNSLITVNYTYAQGVVQADQLFVYLSTDSAVTAGDPCYSTNAVSGSFVFIVKPNTAYYLGVQAARNSAGGMVGGSITLSGLVTSLASNFTGNINSVAATVITTVVTNFNASNDRNATALVAPTILADGTAIDHALNIDGSANLSFEWVWSGAEGDIDGFRVIIYQSSSASAYVLGTSPALETVFEVPASKRAFFLYGCAADTYYTFGVCAYRGVDKDIAASGVLLSTVVKSSLAAENPYRPAANISFGGIVTGTVTGNVTGTVNGVSAVDVGSAKALADAAQVSANTANTALTNIASDNILSPSEKPSVVRDYTVITTEQAGIDAQATAFAITTEKTTYDTAVTALTTYLGTLSGWNTIPGSDVVIVGTAFRTKFSDVYAARQALLNKIDATAATKATWAGTTGAGKPADNATVGAQIGTDVKIWNGSAYVTMAATDFVNTLSKVSAANISTFFNAAAIGNAYIGNAAVDTLQIAGEAVTVPRKVNHGLFAGTGNYLQILTLSIPMDYAGAIIIGYSGVIGYTNFVKNTRFSLKINAVEVFNTGDNTAAYNVTPSIVFSATVGAGTHTVSLEWLGQDNSVSISNGLLYVMGAQR